jgi:hypothetical protein
LYLIALLAPPLAVLSSGKPFQAVFNAVMWAPALLALLMTVVSLGVLGVLGAFAFPFWFLAAGHAALVVHGHHADARTKRLVRATAAAGQTAARAVDAAAAQARATGVTLLPAAAPASPPPALPAPAAGEPAGVTVPASLVAPGKRPKLPCARCGQHVRAVVTAGALACPYCGGPVGA